MLISVKPRLPCSTGHCWLFSCCPVTTVTDSGPLVNKIQLLFESELLKAKCSAGIIAFELLNNPVKSEQY